MEDAVDPLTGSLHMNRAMHMNRAIRHPTAARSRSRASTALSAGPASAAGDRHQPPPSALAPSTFTAMGSFTAVDVQNLPGTTFAERRNATFDTEDGRYTVNADGTGMIIAPGGQAHLVITRARIDGGVKVCLEFLCNQRPTRGHRQPGDDDGQQAVAVSIANPTESRP